MSLDTQFINLNPLTLDGLTTISADSLNLNVGQGVLQSDSLGDIFSSDTITCDTIEPRNNYVNFSINEPAILGVTMTPFIRNAITGSTSIDFDKSTGVISVTGGFASKWGENGNTIYNINSTGTVAVSALVITGAVTMNNGLYVSGNVGIGTAPLTSYKLLVDGSMLLTGLGRSLWIAGETGLGQDGTRVHYINNNTYYDNRGSNGSFIWRNDNILGSTERMRLNGSGHLGVGTTNPAVRLNVVNSGTTVELLRYGNGTSEIYSGSDDTLGPWFGTRTNHNLRLTTNQITRMTINTAGNVNMTNNLNVVGTATFNGNVGVGVEPNYKLHVKGDAVFIEPPNTSQNAQIILHNDTATNKFGGIDYTPTGEMKITNASASGSIIFNGATTISATGNYTSVGDMRLNRAPNTSTGRKMVFSFGTGSAGSAVQGLEWVDNTTTQGQAGIYGGQQSLYFYAGGTQKLSIGANVDFTTTPYVGGNPIDTDDVVEGTNLYFTTARARQSISASSPLSYNNTSGIMSISRNMTNVFNNRIAKPSDFPALSYAVGFGSWNNNNASPWADCIALNTWTDATGDSQNFVAFNKTSGNSGMRIYQGTFGSTANFSTYRDAVMTDANSTNVSIIGNLKITGGLIITGNATYNNSVLSVSGTILAGNAVVESNVLISARKAGGVKIKVSSTNASDAELWASNTTSSYSWYAHNSINSMRLYNYGTATDLMTVLNNGNVGIGNLNPQFLLSLSANHNTTAHIKNNSTTGYAQLFLQSDGVAGGGLILYSTGHASSNALNLSNTVGNIFVNPVTWTRMNGNVGVGGDPSSSVHVVGTSYRTDNSKGGVHIGYPSSTNAILGLVANSTSDISAISFGYVNDSAGGGAPGEISYDYSTNTMNFMTNTSTKMKLMSNGRLFLNTGTQLSTYAGDILQTKGRILIAGYDGSDVNPVITFKDSGNNFHYFYFNGVCSTPGSVANAGFVMSDYLGIGKQPTWQIDLSTDYARKLTSIYWAVVSDQRMKENIVDADLDICYSNVKKLKLRRYNYIEDFGKDEKGEKQYNDNKQLGWIAQEAKEIFPKSVKVTDDSVNGGLSDLHSLDADQIMKTLYGAVQKLMMKVENLEEVIIKERIQYKGMKQIQDGIIRKHQELITKQGILIDSMKKALLLKGISIN